MLPRLPLHMACERCKLPTVKLLLENENVKLDEKDSKGMTAFDIIGRSAYNEEKALIPEIKNLMENESKDWEMKEKRR